MKELLALLWQCEERECQYFAIDVARKQRDLLCGGVQSADGQTGLDAAQCIGRLITAKSWWDTVDLLASNGESGDVSKSVVSTTPQCCRIYKSTVMEECRLKHSYVRCKKNVQPPNENDKYAIDLYRCGMLARSRFHNALAPY